MASDQAGGTQRTAIAERAALIERYFLAPWVDSEAYPINFEPESRTVAKKEERDPAGAADVLWNWGWDL
jgi:hypothetical protein